MSKYLSPLDLTEAQKQIAAKRFGIPPHTTAATAAYVQYRSLYLKQNLPAVQLELDKLHALFAADRMKKSGISS